ncbi:MAG: helix-turn-helix transcriptional regulator [Longicatena sp.]
MIKIGNVIMKLRKEKKITQEELANYMGISKTAVSKWESCQSYPDITFLPILASYFDISIDELMDYQPELTRENATEEYRRLCKSFVEKDFDEVIEECHDLIKKYHSCHYLVLLIATLFVNHAMLSKKQDITTALYVEARDLFAYVEKESDELQDKKAAKNLGVYCDLILHDPKGAIDSFGNIRELESNTLLANAYYMDQNLDKAELTLQVDMFQSILNVFQSYPLFLSLRMQDKIAFEIALDKIVALDNLFEIRSMHPGLVLPIYLSAIQGYVQFQEYDKAIEWLSNYVKLITKEIQCYEIHGKGLFHRINEWIDSQEIDIRLPRDEKIIKESSVSAVVDNRTFDVLREDARFIALCEMLKESLKG